MMRILYTVCVCLIFLSCERRDLTYGYKPTVSVVVETDWSGMDVEPSGMSVYFYPESGGAPTVVQTNNIRMATAELVSGKYDILVFNQIPSDYGTIIFEGMDRYDTAQAEIVHTKSNWAMVRSSDDGALAREPEDLAVSTYEGFEVTEDAIKEVADLRSKGYTKSGIAPYAKLEFSPRLVIKTTRVRIKVSGIDNHRSTRATLYGMASGYDFSSGKSLSDMTTHIMESWAVAKYNDGSNMGELISSFASFGLPEQITTTRGEEQWADWAGRLDVDVLLVDNETIVSKSVPLNDKITLVEDEGNRADVSVDTNVDFDLAIDWGYSGKEGDEPLVLPDVEDANDPGDGGGGFSATLDGWGEPENVDLAL